jgi:hypothetical protein
MTGRQSNNTRAYYSSELIATCKKFHRAKNLLAQKSFKGGVAFPVLDPVTRLDIYLVSRAPAAQW